MPPGDDRVAPHAPRSRWRVVLWRVVLACTIAVALVAAGGFLAVPALVKHVLQTHGAEWTGRRVDVERVEFNPFTLRAALHGVRIAPQDDEPALLELDTLRLRVSAASVRHLAPVLTQLRIDGLRMHVVHLGGGRWNVSEMIERYLARPARPMPHFSLANIELAGGRIEVEDRPARARHVIESIELGIPFVSSLPVDAAVVVQPRLTAVIDGAAVQADAQAAPFVDRRVSSARIRISALDVTPFLRYLPQLPLVVRRALLDAEWGVKFEQPAGGRATVRVDGTAALRDIDVVEQDGAPLMRSPVVRAKFTADPIAARIDVSQLVIERPVLTVHRRANAEFIADRLAASRESNVHIDDRTEGAANNRGKAKADTRVDTRRASGLQLRIAELLATDVAIDARDERGKARLELAVRSGRLAVRGFDTSPESRAAFEIELPAQTGERVAASGHFGMAPLQAEGQVRIDGIDMPRYWPHLAGRLAFEPVSGTLEAKTDFRYAATSSGPTLVLSGTEIGARQLALRRGGTELARAAGLRLTGGELDLQARSLRIGRIDVKAGAAAVQRGSDGRFDWTGLITPQPPDAAPTVPVAPNGDEAPLGNDNAATRSTTAGAGSDKAAAWAWSIEQVGLRDMLINLQDLHVVPMVRTAVTIDDAQLGSLSSRSDTPARLSLRARMESGATLAAEGTVQTTPQLAAGLDVDLRRLAVVPLAPYYAAQLGPRIARGLVSARGRLELQSEPKLRIGWRGALSADEFRVTEPGSNRTLLRWQSVALSGVTLTAAPGDEPMAVDVGGVEADTFFARLVIDPQGQLNLQNLLRKGGAQSADGAAAAARSTRQAEAAPRVRIGPVTLRNGSVEFSDQFVRPNYSANLQAVQGTVSAITVETPGEVRLEARLDGYAPVRVEGRLNPLAPDLFLELTANARGIDLPSLSTYAAKYAGYGIERGKLSMEARYRIESRQLSAENRLTLDQLSFGPKVDSPTATQLPVRLLVSLLQDRNGTIDLRLPISGSLDDPQFSIGAVVRRALGNLVTRILTSPFAFLASLGGGGDTVASDMASSVAFDAGASQLSEQSQQHLVPLAKALVDRPALKVDLIGYADAGSDRDALAQAAFDRRLRQHKRRMLAATRESAGSTPIEQIQIEPAEYEAVVSSMYRDAELPEKPRIAGEPAAKVPLDMMERALRESIQTTEDDLRTLATARARAVERALSSAGVAPERLFVAAPRLAGERNSKPVAAADGAAAKQPVQRTGVELVLR